MRRARSALLPMAGLALVAHIAGCENRERMPKVSLTNWSFVGAAMAQQADRVVPPAAITGALQPVDEAFARFAASSSLAEIEGARLVLKASKKSEVREYAEKLVREHMRAADALRRIAEKRGVILPSAPTGRHADLVTKLSGVAAPERDEAFLHRFGIDAHKETIALVERHLTEGKDPELRRFAEQTLPMLRDHMSAATQLLHAAAAGR